MPADSEPQRRPLFQRLAGLVYRGTDFVEAVSEPDGAAAYFVEVDDGAAVERRLDTRRL
jgi:hypothetical protein